MSKRQKPIIVDIGKSLKDSVSYTEECAIMFHLYECDGNVVKATKSLGTNRQTLYNKCKEYGINLNLFRRGK
jgi:DNA-binding NtrC family response regulator